MKKVVLITGVSSGFGKEAAVFLAQAGYRVYGTVRKDTEPLQAVHLLNMDLTKTESIDRAVAELLERENRIDVLINNAGMHLGGPIEETPSELYRRQLETNLFGMVHLLQLVLPPMREQGKGLIINFSSIGGLMGLPFQAFYSASKFAIEGLSEALRMEVQAFGIKVVLVNPGDFHTSNTVNRINVCAGNGPYSKQFELSRARFESDEIKGGRPAVMALKLLKIIEAKKPKHRYIVSTFDQKLAVLLKYLLPSSWFMTILASHYGIKKSTK